MRARLITFAVVALTAALALVAPAGALAATGSLDSGDVYARFDGTYVTLGNGFVERQWSRAPLRTTELLDKRAGGRSFGAGRDFTLQLGGVEIGSERFTVSAVSLDRLARGGVRVSMHLAGSGAAAGLTAIRTAEAYPGVAGFRTQTVLVSFTPLALSSATLDQAVVGAHAAPVARSFRAGSDWRDANWAGPPLWTGYAQQGDFRQDVAAPAGGSVEANGEWIDAREGGRSLFMVMERNDLPSSRVAYDGTTARLRVDYSKDVIDLGPFEEQFHFENPGSGGGRTRTLRPGHPFALEAAFTGFAVGHGDEAWQWHHYLVDHRVVPFPHPVTFNSDKVDSNNRSTGSKDDMDFQAVQAIAPIARRLGVESFVLDDGWASRDGDWQPDSPQYPEPRYDGSPGSKFRPRFPDPTFSAARAAIAPMRLGLWMSPLEFNPQAQAYKSHPQWACHPISDPLVAANLADPDGGTVSSSNEAGIGPWANSALPHIEARIRDAIDHWGARFFKFDFMVWLDCAGQNDLYEQHDAFLAMIDRLRRDHPDVVFQTDETNDYRLFPFESTARGPTWFQNGAPGVPQLLHNLWLLGPYVPTYAIGQHTLGGDSWKTADVNTLMAAALPSDITFWTDLRKLPDPVIATAARWVRFYRDHRHSFSLATYALLADPLKDDWTALQEWDPEAARGALLAFRQSSAEATKRIALRNVPPGLRFRLVQGPGGKQVGTATSAELTRGVSVTLPAKGRAKVLLIEPIAKPPPTIAGPGVDGGVPRAAGCVDGRQASFPLRPARRGPVVEVYAYLDGKRVLHRRGRDLRAIALKGLPRGGFELRLEMFQGSGAETIAVRRYTTCEEVQAQP